MIKDLLHRKYFHLIFIQKYIIYMVLSRNKDFKRKMDKNTSFIGETKIIDIDEIEREKSLVKNSHKEKINYIEDNISFFFRNRF